MSISLLRQLLMKEAVKKSAGSSGIMTINKNIARDVEQQLQKYISSAQSQGVDLDTLGPEQLKMIVELNKPKNPLSQAISADSPEGRKITEALFGKQKAPVVDINTGKTMDTSQGIMGGKSVKELMKKNKKIEDREMFKNSNLNETDDAIKARLEAGNKKSVKKMGDKREMNADELEYFEQEVGDNIDAYDFDGTVGSGKKIMKDIKDYEAEMFAQYKMGKLDPSPGDGTPARKRFLQKKSEEAEMSGDKRLITEDEIAELMDLENIPDYAKGGRAGYYGGGMTNMVEPDLSDIGHGGEALNSRTRLLSPGSQATTSTGLNYLLGDDNDNTRVPFAGGGMGKRAFLKFLASGAAGIAGLKSGLFGLGKKAAVKTAAPIVAEAAVVPPHFLKLVAKIKSLGDDAPRLATKDKEIVTTYSSGKPGYSKDYTLTEDITTGEMTIQRTQMDDALKYDASEYYGRPLQEEVYMSYRPGKGLADETTKGKNIPDEYTEDTALIRNDKPARGEVSEEISGVPDDIYEEVGEVVPEAIKKGKADGGRITYSSGGLAAMLGE